MSEKSFILPSRLQKGDKVAIVSPAAGLPRFFRGSTNWDCNAYGMFLS